MLISNHLRQFLSCDADITKGTATWQWHPTPQPWNSQFQFQFFSKIGEKQEPIDWQGSNDKTQVVWMISKWYIGWIPQKQELRIFSEMSSQTFWTIKPSTQSSWTFSLLTPHHTFLTLLPELHVAMSPPPLLTQLHVQFIPSTTPISPGVLDYPFALFQDPYVMATNKAGELRVMKCPQKTLDVLSVLVKAVHVEYHEERWRVLEEDPVDLYRSHGRHVALFHMQTKQYLGTGEKEVLEEWEELGSACVFEFHKLPHSPLAFGLRSIVHQKYLGVNRGRLAWVHPTRRFFWTFLVPPTFAAAIVDLPLPKMPKRMVVTMTAIISAAAIGAITGITNFLINL